MNASKPDADQDVNLTKASAGLKKLLIAGGWDFSSASAVEAGEPLDMDLSAFILGRDNLTREDEDFVFYNNPQGAQLAVKHLGADRAGDDADQAVLVDLDNLSFEVWRIVFVASLYQGNEHDQNLSRLTGLTVRIENADTNAVIHAANIPAGGLADSTAVVLGELYRNGVEWHFVPGGKGIPGGLAEAARGYGLQISSTT
jgi:tellurium resistance protein TerD